MAVYCDRGVDSKFCFFCLCHLRCGSEFVEKEIHWLLQSRLLWDFWNERNLLNRKFWLAISCCIHDAPYSNTRMCTNLHCLLWWKFCITSSWRFRNLSSHFLNNAVYTGFKLIQFQFCVYVIKIRNCKNLKACWKLSDEKQIHYHGCKMNWKVIFPPYARSIFSVNLTANKNHCCNVIIFKAKTKMTTFTNKLNF